MNTGDRFEFGSNWSRFLGVVDETRIAAAVESLQTMLGVERLDGKTFLDIGSGSGLFSLAAHRLGAVVHSFDYDPQSVACTREMQRRYGSLERTWTIEEGSALDAAYLNKLGTFDIVYSWGVLHHTGEQWAAMERTATCVPQGGTLFIAIYNDQGRLSDRWKDIKQFYQRLPRVLRPLLVMCVGAAMLLQRVCDTMFSSLLRLMMCRNPLTPFRRLRSAVQARNPRGMHRWYDLVDWVGGWPFEVAKPEEVINFYAERGFQLVRMTTCGGNQGCNEFVFNRKEQPPAT